MSSIRISAHIRDEFISNVLAHKFAVERAHIAEQEGEIIKLQNERNRLGYEMVYSEKARNRLNEAPSGWYPTVNSVQVMVEDAGVQRIFFGGDRLVPYDDSANNYNKVVAIVDGTNPYFEAQAKVQKAKDKLKDFTNDLYAEERAVKARVTAVINSVTTTGRLLEVWPEAQQFLPEMVSSTSGGVPAEFIGDLNNFLNIGKS